MESTEAGKGEQAQLYFLDSKEWWEDTWQGMPEFVQKDLQPIKSIYVHFETRKDMEDFSRLVEQTITIQTRAIWYPKAEIGRIADKRYVDEPRDEVIGEDEFRVERSEI